MLQLYDLNKTKIQGLKKYKDLNIESILSTGDKTLSFLFPSNLSKNIKEEGYIRTKLSEFVIKEITDNKEWKSIKATLNIEALEGQPWEHFDTTEKTITECLTLALAGTGWTIGTCNVTKRRTVRKTNCSSWDIIQQAKKTYLAEMQFDTLNKKINISEKLGSDKGVYFMDSLNLKNLDIQSNSYDFYTRIIAIGKDDLKVTVENYQYSNKKKTLIWKDERYTVLESLREDATAKLEELSKPYKAYKADIIDLANISNKYSILSYGLGDTITLTSKEKGIKEKQRIVKITEYPEEPERNTCEIANTLLRFEDIQKEQQDTTDTVNNITTDNGTVDGSSINSIKAEQISDFEVSVGKVTNLTVLNARIENLYVKKADIDSLNAVEIRVGNLIATKASITDFKAEVARINALYATSATIENLNATNGKITLLETKVGSIDTILSKEIFVELATAGKIVAGSSIIAEGAIGSAQISSLSATKLSAGIIDAAVITVKNLNADNITVGSINGQRIANGAIDNSKVANNANISGSKLNINDVIVNINGSTTQINGTKIQVGDRTLDVELSTQKIVLEENKTNISKQQATIVAMDNAIKLKVDNQTFNTFKTATDGNIVNINTNLNKNTASIDVLQKDIKLKVSQDEIDKSINDLDFSVRNLLLDSGIRSETIDYNIKKYKLSTKIENGTTVTISIKGSLGNGKSFFGIYNSGGSLSVAQLFPGDLNSDGVYTKTFKWAVGATTNTELWIYQIPSDVVASSTIEWTTLVEGNKPPKDWTPAPEDIDKAINTVDTKINTKVSEINVSLNGITSRVGKTESATTTIDGKVTALSTRVATAEQKITPDGIVATVTSSTAYKNDLGGKATTTALTATETKITQLADLISHKVESTDFATYRTQTDRAIADKVGGPEFSSYRLQTDKLIAQSVGSAEFNTYKTQTANAIAQRVTQGDVISTVTQRAGQMLTEFSKTGEVIIKNGNFSIEHANGGKMFWVQGGRINAAALDLYAVADGTFKIYGPGAKGMQLISENDKEIYIDFKRSGTAPYNGRISMPKANQMQYICDSHYFGGSSAITSLTVQGQILSETSIYAKERIEGHSFHSASGYITANKALWFTDPTFSAVQDINVRTAIHHGAKTALVDTKSYGKTFVYAEESTAVRFSDYGEGVIGEDGLCYVHLEQQYMETVTTSNSNYRIQLTSWAGCNAEIQSKHPTYFVVRGNINKKFEWKVIADRKGYENMRFNEAMEANNCVGGI